MQERKTPDGQHTDLIKPATWRRSNDPDQPIQAVKSASWTPDGIAAHLTEQESYLEQVIATPELQEVGKVTLAHLDLRPGQRVLDAGCGPGLFLAPLAERVGPAGHVAGIDFSPDFAAAARERIATLDLIERVSIEEADVCHLPFADAAFDAAHCERLLMHLADPVAALTELRRVVRPGGSMVAAESDWHGIRIDHPDQEAIALLVRRGTADIAQPALGLGLPRHMAAAGFTGIRATPVIFPVRKLEMFAVFGLDLPGAADRLVGEGTLTRERVDGVLAWLAEANANGTLFAYGGLIVASGRVPGA